MRVVVIGCGDCGLSAAFSAAKEGAEVTVISEGPEFYPRCPLPYYVAGKIKEESLVTPLEKLFRGSGVKVIVGRATRIDGSKVVCEGGEYEFDSAIIATGASAKTIPGSLALRTLEDAKRIKKLAEENDAVIVGGGMLGCELADVLGGTLVEAKERILPNFDPEFSELVEKELETKVDIKKGSKKALGSKLMISAIGVLPNTAVAKESGIRTSEFGIVVDENLQTSMENVYAGGDCIEEKCFFTKKPMHSYLGPQAERQGTIAAKNACGGNFEYGGTLNAVVAKIGDYELGIAGLCSEDAKRKGLKTTFGRVKTKTKKTFFPGAEDIMIKMTFEGERLVGCQAIGGSSVEGIINLCSYAMQKGATVDDLITMPYCYSPPICSAPNPIILCAENAKRRMKNE